MSEFVKVAVDAMGGDNAPGEIVKGVVDAINEKKDIKVSLYGIQDKVEAELAKYSYDKDRIEIINTTEIIETAESPVAAVRTKKDSSLVKAMYAVKNGECDAVVSAGSSGAILVGGQTIVGRLKGVNRSPLAPIIPTLKGGAILIDCGANVDAKPQWLVQFAKMGKIYCETILGKENPRVAIVNIGAEEEKGNALVKETMPLLKEIEGINFIGSVEARDIPYGYADVIVCDAFVGNVILKMLEGTASVLLSEIKSTMMSSVKTKIGALLIKKKLKEKLKLFDAKEYGGAPLLGLNGLVVKTHGSAEAIEVKHSILQCKMFKDNCVNDQIMEVVND